MASAELEKLINNLKFTSLETPVYDRKQFIEKAAKYILSHKQLRSHTEFPKLLECTLVACLTSCSDENDAIRMLASDCLNHIIKTFQYQYYPTVFKALLQEIKSNRIQRTIRAALIRFAHLLHQVKPVDVSHDVHEVINSFIKVAKRADEESVQEALGVAIEKCMPFMAYYLDKDKTIHLSFNKLIEVLLDNIKSQPPNIKRISSTALVDIYKNTRDPKSSCSQLLTTLVDLVDPSPSSSEQIETDQEMGQSYHIGSFICLKILLPNLGPSPKTIDALVKMTESIMSTVQTSQDITMISSALEALMSIFESSLINFHAHRFQQLVNDCSRLIVSKFLLTGRRGECWPDSHSRVSIKALTLSCLASIVKIKPEILFLRLYHQQNEQETQQSGSSQLEQPEPKHTPVQELREAQFVEDIFLLKDHPDHQIQSNLASIRGNFLASCWRLASARYENFSCDPERTNLLNEEEVFVSSKSCYHVRRLWSELFQTIKQKSLHSLTMKACIDAIKTCLPQLLESDHCIHVVQPTDFDCLLQLVTTESYWLVKIELYELFSNLNYRTISYLENYHWIHTTNRISNSFVGCIQDRVLKSLAEGLLNDDPKVRTGASAALIKIVPRLYILHCDRDINRQIAYSTPTDPIVALAQELAWEHFAMLKQIHNQTAPGERSSNNIVDSSSNHDLNSFQLKILSSSIIHEDVGVKSKKASVNKNLVINLHHIVNLLMDILYENFDKKKELASIVNNINELAKIYPIVEYPECWDCRANENSKCFKLLNFLLSYIGSTSTIRKDLDAYRRFLALSQNLLAALCHQSVKARYELQRNQPSSSRVSDQSQEEAHWASLTVGPAILNECLDVYFNHLIKLLNAFVCVIDDKYIMANSTSQNAPNTVQQQQQPSSSTLPKNTSTSSLQKNPSQLFKQDSPLKAHTSTNLVSGASAPISADSAPSSPVSKSSVISVLSGTLKRTTAPFTSRRPSLVDSRRDSLESVSKLSTAGKTNSNSNLSQLSSTSTVTTGKLGNVSQLSTNSHNLSDDIDARSDHFTSMSSSSYASKSPTLSSATSLLSNQLIIEIYEQLRLSYQSGRSNIDQSSEKYYQLMEVCLEGIGELLEYLSLSAVAKYSKELLVYFKTTHNLDPSLSIMCSRQLLKSLFGINILALYNNELPDQIVIDSSLRSPSLLTANDQSFEFLEDSADQQQLSNYMKQSDDSSPKSNDVGYGGVYYHLISSPYGKFSNYYAIKSTQITPPANRELSSSNYEIKKTLTIRKLVEQRAQSLFDPKNLTSVMFELRTQLLNHITDFSPIVMDCMDSFEETGFCQVQCESLHLICYLILIKVNYKLLDKAERFITSVNKIIDLVGDKIFSNRTYLIDKLLQNCFTFLILLSYERYQCEPVTQMASIIQKFDHLRASEQDPNIYIIPVLKCLVEDLFLCRNMTTSSNEHQQDVSISDIFEAEREMVAKSLIDLIQYPAIYDMLSILIQESRHDNSEIKCKKLSQKLTSTIYPMLSNQQINLYDYESIKKIHTILESISPDVFKPIEFIMKTLFAAQSNCKNDILEDSVIFDRWLGLVLIVMQILITQVKEEVFLFRLDENKINMVSLWPFQLMSPRNSPTNMPESMNRFHKSESTDNNKSRTSTRVDVSTDIFSSQNSSSSSSSSPRSSPLPYLNENNYLMCISSDDLMSDYLLHVAQLSIAEISHRNMYQRKDELLLVQQLSSYLIYLAHMFQSGLYCRLTRSAITLIQRIHTPADDLMIDILSDARSVSKGFCLTKCSLLFARISSIYPDLTIQWCNILMLLNCVDCNDIYWQRLLSYDCSNCYNKPSRSGDQNDGQVALSDNSNEGGDTVPTEIVFNGDQEDGFFDEDFVFKRANYISKPSALGLAKSTFDGQFRKSFIKKITSTMAASTTSRHQTFLNDYRQASLRLAPNMELSRRGTLCLVLDFVGDNMNDVEHITWIIINYVNDLISWSNELPIRDFIKAIHRNSASSGLFIQAVNARCNDLSSSIFIHKMLECLCEVHHTQYGSLVVLLIEKLLLSPQLLPYLTLARDIEIKACETIIKLLDETNKNLIITLEEVANQMTLVDVNRLANLLDPNQYEDLSKHLDKLRDYITRQTEPMSAEIVGDDVLQQQNEQNEKNSHHKLDLMQNINEIMATNRFSSDEDSEFKKSDEVGEFKPVDQSWFVEHFSNYFSPRCNDRKAINLLQNLKLEEVTSILNRPDLDMEKLSLCIIKGSDSILTDLRSFVSITDIDQRRLTSWPVLEASVTVLMSKISVIIKTIEESCPTQLVGQQKEHKDQYFLPSCELAPEEMLYYKWKFKLMSDQKLGIVEQLIILSSSFQALVRHFLPMMALLSQIPTLKLPYMNEQMLSNVVSIFRLYSELINWMASDQARYSYILHLVPALNAMRVCLSSCTIMERTQNDISLLCTVISSVHSLCKCYLTHNVEGDEPIQWSTNEEKGSRQDIDHVRKACIKGVELVDFIEQLDNVHNSLNGDCKLRSPMIYDALRPLLVLVCRISLINSFVLVPPILWKRCAWPRQFSKSDDDKFKVKISMIPSDLLQDVDILDRFSHRLNTIGWTCRVQFEEIWMSLLGVLGPALEQQRQRPGPSDLDEKDKHKLACLAIKTITKLFLTAKLARPGDPTSTYSNERNQCDTNANFKIINLTKGVSTKLFNMRQQTKATLEALEGSCHQIEGSGLSDSNNCELGKYFTISAQQLRISLHSNKDDVSESTSPPQPTSFYLDNQSLILLNKADNQVDFRSCIRFLLDVYGQKLNNSGSSPVSSNQKKGSGPSLPAPLVTEICKSLISLMDYFTDFQQFEWLYETFIELFRQADVNKDDYQMQYLIVGICKSAAVCQLLMNSTEPQDGAGGLPFEKFRKYLVVCLHSEFMPTRVKALNGIRYILCDNSIKLSATSRNSSQMFLINKLKPIILDYLTRHFFSDDGNSRIMVQQIEEDHLTSMWMLALMLCEQPPADMKESGSSSVQSKNQQFDLFRQRIIQRSTGAIMSETVPRKLFKSVAEHLEILMLLGRLLSREEDHLVRCAMERLKSSQIKLTSLVCLNLLLSSLYKRAKSIEQQQPQDKDDEKLVLAMERISVMFDRLRNCSSDEASIICSALTSILYEFLPAKDVLNKLVSEFLSNRQPHLNHLAYVIFQIFGHYHSDGQQELIHEWVTLSLISFFQLKPIQLATWSLSCFLISASSNKSIRSMFPLVQARYCYSEALDERLFLTICQNLYSEIQLIEHRRIFKSLFKAASMINANAYGPVYRFLCRNFRDNYDNEIIDPLRANKVSEKMSCSPCDGL